MIPHYEKKHTNGGPKKTGPPTRKQRRPTCSSTGLYHKAAKKAAKNVRKPEQGSQGCSGILLGKTRVKNGKRKPRNKPHLNRGGNCGIVYNLKSETMASQTIKYKAVYNTTKIEDVEILSETGSFVSIKGWNGKPQREAKQSNYCTYHDTREAAKADILARLEETRRTRQMQLVFVESEIEKAKTL